MDTDTSSAEVMPHEEAVPGKTGRAPQIVLTTATNLIQLKKELKSAVKGKFEFRSTINWTIAITNTMADFSVVKSYLQNNNVAYFTFNPKIPKAHKGLNTLHPSQRSGRSHI
jgi:hypothetical protein